MAYLKLAIQMRSGLIEYKGRLYTINEYKDRVQMLKVEPILLRYNGRKSGK